MQVRIGQDQIMLLAGSVEAGRDAEAMFNRLRGVLQAFKSLTEAVTDGLPDTATEEEAYEHMRVALEPFLHTVMGIYADPGRYLADMDTLTKITAYHSITEAGHYTKDIKTPPPGSGH